MFVPMCNKLNAVMKKHFFNVIAALALVCGVFAFTGCADFESDINSINERLDALETGQIASLEEQIATLTSALDEAKGAIATLEGSVGDLDAAKEDLQSQIDELNTRIESNDGDIDKLVDQVADLEVEVARIDGLESDLEDLKATVAEIEGKLDDYATKEDLEEATLDIKGDIEALNNSLGKLEGRVEALETSVEDLESDLGDLQGQIPGILEDIKAAQDSASSALGNIRSLREAFDVFTKTFDSKIEELELRDSTLMDNIDKLSDSLKANVSDLQGQIDQLKEELANKVNKDEFSDMVAEEIKKSIEAGYINDAISEAISELTEQINKQIGDVEKRIDDLTSDLVIIIGGLADNIQSLVFVPEYKDGMATSYYYTVAEKPLVDFQRVQATFQVTPAKLAASISNENAVLYVVPVKPETRAAAPAITVAGENLEIVADGSTGRIEVDAIVPITKEVGKDIAIALYVADEYVVNEAINNSDLGNIDLGNYVSSEYVQVNIDEKASALDDKYVLYNFTEEEEFPATLEVEKDWTMAPATVTFYEGYELAFDMAGDIVRLEEAAEALRLPVEAITPDYEPVVLYTPVMGNGVTISLDEEKGYGMIASMPATSEEAVKHVGDIAYVNNIFNINGKAVIENATSYEIIPVTFELNLPNLNEVDFPKNKIEWTYQLAKDHKILYKGTQEPLDLDEMLIENWDSVAVLPGAAKNIYEIINDGTPSFDKVLRTVEGAAKPEDLTDDFNASDVDGDVRIDAQAFKVAQVANVTIDGYDFEKGKTVTYDIQKVYDDSEGHTRVIFNLTYTLGAMPEDQTIDLGNFQINFIGSSYDVQKLGDRPFEDAFSADHFANLAEFKASLENDGTEYGATEYAYTVESWRNNEQLNSSSLWTYLGILNGGNGQEDYVPAYLRTSSSDITKFGDKFEFTTTVETWYGVTYEFNATSEIVAPAYELRYDEVFVKDGAVELDGIVNASGLYDFPSVNLSNYVYIANADQLNDGAYVKFEITTKEDQLNGITNIPTLTKTEGTAGTDTYIYADIYRANEVNEMIQDVFVHWNGFTGRAIDVDAVLYIRTQNGTEIEVNRLPVHIWTEDPITLFDTETITVSDRVAGEDYSVNVWKSFNIEGILEGAGRNITLYYGEAEPRPFEVYNNMLTNSELTKYQPEFDYGKITYQVMDGPYTNAAATFDSTTGVFTFDGDNGVLQNDLIVTIPVTLRHTMDYNGVEAHEETITIIFKAQR